MYTVYSTTGYIKECPFSFEIGRSISFDWTKVAGLIAQSFILCIDRERTLLATIGNGTVNQNTNDAINGYIHDDELLYMSDMKWGQCWHSPPPLIHCLALFSLSPLPCNSAAPRANLTVTVTISRLATLLDKMMSYILLPQWFLFLKKSIVCSLRLQHHHHRDPMYAGLSLCCWPGGLYINKRSGWPSSSSHGRRYKTLKAYRPDGTVLLYGLNNGFTNQYMYRRPPKRRKALFSLSLYTS